MFGLLIGFEELLGDQAEVRGGFFTGDPYAEEVPDRGFVAECIDQSQEHFMADVELLFIFIFPDQNVPGLFGAGVSHVVDIIHQVVHLIVPPGNSHGVSERTGEGEFSDVLDGIMVFVLDSFDGSNNEGQGDKVVEGDLRSRTFDEFHFGEEIRANIFDEIIADASEMVYEVGTVAFDDGSLGFVFGMDQVIAALKIGIRLLL